MITTVTLNTAVDKLYLVENVAPSTVMRVKEVCNTAGGKGLNVSKVAALAGEDVCATGFLGGFNGEYVRSLLQVAGIRTEFCEIDCETRSCINIRDLATGEHTEYLEPGAEVSQQNLDDFIAKLETLLPDTDILSISGSVPKGTPVTFYSNIIKMAKKAGKPVIIDTSGELLVESAKALPTMIKPNTDEIEQLLGGKITSREQLIDAAKRLHQTGIEYVAVSLGKEGSILVCNEGVFAATLPEIQAVNTVGCGDSMLAGFAISIARGYNAAEMLAFATAISAANALEMPTGHIQKSNLESLLPQVKINKLL